MQEKQTVNQSKNKYSTLPSVIFHILFTLLLLTILAWFVLVILFGVRVLLNGSYTVTKEVNLIIETNMTFVSHQVVGYIKTILSYINYLKINSLQYLNYAAELSRNLLQKINYKFAFNTQEMSLALVTILFGTVEILFGRLILFLLNLPFLLGFLFVLAVDGLGQRDIRKFQGARESTFIFHRIKPLTSKFFFLCFLLYMSVPLALAPTLLLTPMELFLSVMLMLSIKSYKKYV